MLKKIINKMRNLYRFYQHADWHLRHGCSVRGAWIRARDNLRNELQQRA